VFLIPVKKGLWTVYEVCGEDGVSPLIAWGSSLNENYAGSFRRLFAIINQISANPRGPTLLPKDISHEANKGSSIYELIAGDLRLLWFYSEHQKKVIICSCQHVKSGRKVNKQEINRIINLRKKYSEAYLADEITYFDNGDQK
jgi:hypothetical protein